MTGSKAIQPVRIML